MNVYMRILFQLLYSFGYATGDVYFYSLQDLSHLSAVLSQFQKIRGLRACSTGIFKIHSEMLSGYFACPIAKTLTLKTSFIHCFLKKIYPSDSFGNCWGACSGY